MYNTKFNKSSIRNNTLLPPLVRIPHCLRFHEPCYSIAKSKNAKFNNCVQHIRRAHSELGTFASENHNETCCVDTTSTVCTTRRTVNTDVANVAYAFVIRLSLNIYGTSPYAAQCVFSSFHFQLKWPFKEINIFVIKLCNNQMPSTVSGT
jgi:hypothetical protein